MNRKLFLSLLAVFVSIYTIQSQQSQTINVSIPGNLNVLLGENVNSITDLTLTGTLNENDFTTIKLMTSLVNLNMSKADVVNESIPANSFANKTFEKLILSNSIKSIGNTAFEKTTILEKLILPAGITELGQNVFHEAKLLGGIVLPSSLIKTGSGIFWAAQIPSVDFSICTELEEIGFYSFARTRIAEGVVDLSTNSKLKKFGSNPSTSEGVFPYYEGKVILPINMEYLPDYTFAKFLGVPVFPESLKTIGLNAFEKATISPRLVLPVNVATISKDAFLEADLVGGLDFSICTNLEELGLHPFAKMQSGDGLIDLSTNSKLKKFGSNPSTSEGVFSKYEGKVILPTNMEYLPDFTFAKFLGVPVFLESLKTIGLNAFEKATISPRLVLPVNLTTILKDAFLEANLVGGLDFSICTNLEELGLHPFAKMQSGDGLVDLSTNNKLAKFDKERIVLQGAFSYYSGKVILPTGMTNLPDYSFARFTGEVVFPSNLDSIGMNAFEMSTISQKLIIPSGVTYMAKDIFHEAKLLDGIVLPSSLIKTGSGIFWAAQIPSVDFSICTELEEIGFYSFAKARIAEGVVDLSTNSKLKKFGSNPSTSEGGFSKYEGKVILPTNMEYLPDYTFAKFQGVPIFPESLKTIGLNAFEKATISPRLVLPVNVTTILKDAFLEANLIGGLDFSICTNLEELGLHPFAKMQSGDGLVDLSTNNKLAKFDKERIALQGAFSYYSGKVILPTGMTNLPDYSFARFTGEVVFPSNLDSIGMNAFEMSTISQKLIIPSGVTYMAKDIFHEAKLEGGIVLPASLRKMGSGIFWAAQVPTVDFSICTELEDIGFYNFSKACIADSVVDLSTNSKLNTLRTNPSTSEGVFSYYSGDVILPNHIEVIPSFTFARFGGRAELPASLKKIESKAFLNSTINEIEIPELVNYIGDDAFFNCVDLDKIVSDNVMPPALGTTVFRGVDTNTCNLFVPSSSLASYTAADQWKDFLSIMSISLSEIKAIEQAFDEDQTMLSVYPNPTSDVLNINGSNIKEINIYRIDGGLVKSVIKSNTIDMRDLSSGIYIVKILTSSGVKSQKVVKK